MKYLIIPALVAVGLASAGTAAAEDTWTDPFPGVRHLHRVTTEPNQNIHVLEVDLCQDGISFRATKFDERGQRTSDFGSSVEAQAAVNGDFFVSGFGLERGIAVGDGEPWPPSNIPDDPSTGQVAIGENRLELIPDWVVQETEDWMHEVVGGRPTVLREGAIPDTSGHATLCKRNPRTAIGLSEDRRTLFIAVVDGRATTRVGMTCTELGELMQDLGAHDALNLDGGGSSTMWLEGEGVLNYPTDGRERTVGNHLALMASGEGPAQACPVARAKRVSLRSGTIEAATDGAPSGSGCAMARGSSWTTGTGIMMVALFAARRLRRLRR
ncbi:phosphodiester glycosidase family protein [Pendulispora rubella]|uniref:Phosphodiester glycosidase family protein n=1 Tax=Pendulispora rubella TaxID=2741070 RepID=A0ABZ2L3C6_9BACT